MAGRDLSVTEVSDDGGTVRVRLVLPTWDDYVRAAVTDVLPALARVRADLAARRARP